MEDILLKVRREKRSCIIMDTNFLGNPEISATAKGIWGCVLALKTDGIYDISAEILAKYCADDESVITEGLKELVDNGYMEGIMTSITHDPKGIGACRKLQVDWIAFSKSGCFKDSELTKSVMFEW